MVLVSRAEKRAIFTYLLKEGVIVVRKDAYLPKHQDLEGVANLKVMMIVKSLTSQGYLQGVFNWQWNYYTVTSKGVQFLVKTLGKWSYLASYSFSFIRCLCQCGPIHLQAEEDRRHRSS